MPRRSYKDRLVEAAYESRSVIIDPGHPHQWTSGFWMPVYTDHDRLLLSYEHRLLVNRGLRDLITHNGLKYDIIAGLKTAPQSFGTTLANSLKADFIYVDPKTGEIGCIPKDQRLDGKEILPVEDAVSTAGSLATAVRALRNAGGSVNNCVAITTYEFPEAEKLLDSLSCRLFTLLTFHDLLGGAKGFGVSDEYIRETEAWHSDKFNWGERHGYPRSDRK